VAPPDIGPYILNSGLDVTAITGQLFFSSLVVGVDSIKLSFPAPARLNVTSWQTRTFSRGAVTVCRQVVRAGVQGGGGGIVYLTYVRSPHLNDVFVSFNPAGVRGQNSGKLMTVTDCLQLLEHTVRPAVQNMARTTPVMTWNLYRLDFAVDGDRGRRVDGVGSGQRAPPHTGDHQRARHRDRQCSRRAPQGTSTRVVAAGRSTQPCADHWRGRPGPRFRRRRRSCMRPSRRHAGHGTARSRQPSTSPDRDQPSSRDFPHPVRNGGINSMVPSSSLTPSLTGTGSTTATACSSIPAHPGRTPGSSRSTTHSEMNC